MEIDISKPILRCIYIYKGQEKGIKSNGAYRCIEEGFETLFQYDSGIHIIPMDNIKLEDWKIEFAPIEISREVKKQLDEKSIVAEPIMNIKQDLNKSDADEE